MIGYTEGMGREQLAGDEKTFDAVMRNLEIIGEAVRHIPQDLRDHHTEVPWRGIAGFRDVAIHAYPAIDEEVVWDVVQNKIPELLGQAEGILAAEFGAGGLTA